MFRTLLAALLAFIMIGSPAMAQRSPYPPPDEDEAIVEPPLPEVDEDEDGPLPEMPDDYIRSYGLPPRPDPEKDSPVNDDWKAVQENYQNSEASGDPQQTLSVPAVSPAPAAPVAVPAPATGTATYQNSDCKYAQPCFAGVIATPLNQSSITSATNFISFTVPYLVVRGNSCPAKQSFSIWVGNAHTNLLWQAGLLVTLTVDASCKYVPSETVFTPFWQAYGPAMPNPLPIPNIPVAPGNKIYVTIWNIAGTRNLKAQFSNLSTGKTAIISYTAPINLTAPYFLWKAESYFPPKFGAMSVCGIATDQAGKMYRSGDVSTAKLSYWHMVNSNYKPNTWVPITNVTKGCFVLRGQ